MNSVLTLQVGQQHLAADFRSVIDQRRQGSGPGLAYFSPLGVQAVVPTATAADVDEAVRLGRHAHHVWRNMAPSERRSALMRLAELIDKNAAELGALDCADMGKPISVATQEAHGAAYVLRWYAEAIDKSGGFVAPSHPSTLAYALPVPYGVVGAIVSWNYPAINAMMKIAPAVAAGNAIVLKPSQNSPLSALRIADLALEAGLPSGLISVLYTSGAIGSRLCDHDGVDMLAFTGSTATGIHVATRAAAGVKPLLLECGGKNPILVTDDISDIEGLTKDTVKEAFANTGQLCVARSKLIVPKRLHGGILEALLAAVDNVVSGDPTHSETTYGPLAYPAHAESIHTGIEKAIASGSRLIRDGRGKAPSDIACRATLLDAQGPEVPAMIDEFFGPVLSVYAYDTLEEGIAAANAGSYGLAATVWTQDLRRARYLTQQIRTGQLTVRASAGLDNTERMALPSEPSGHSGYGVEFGIKALESYSRTFAVQYIGLDSLEASR